MRKKQKFIIKHTLLLFLVAVTAYGFYDRFGEYVEEKQWFPLFVYLSIWAVSLLSVTLISFAPLRPLRLFWTILFTISLMFGLGYGLITGDRLTWDALAGMMDATLPPVGFFAFYAPDFILPGIAAGLFLTVMVSPPFLPAMKKPVNYLAACVLPLIPFSILCSLVWVFGGTGGFETRGMPLFLQPLSVLAVYQNAQLETDSVTKHSPRFEPEERPFTKHIVLIIDESLSGDFIDLNVPRNITPHISSESAHLVNFGLATSASSCSHVSNAVLRLGASPKSFEKPSKEVMSLPGIWAYADQAGFTTNMIDVIGFMQERKMFSSAAEFEQIDHYHSFQGLWLQGDHLAAKLLLQILKRPSPQFVLLNKRGVHTPYRLSYPDGLMDSSLITSRDELVSQYERAISWSVDEFFSIIFSEIESGDTTLVFTSDHGQNLRDNGLSGTHCMPTPAHLNEVSVPLFIYTNNATLKEDLRQAATMNLNRVSHFEVFPSMLRLMGYGEEEIRAHYHQSFFEPITEPMAVGTNVIMARKFFRVSWLARDELEWIER